MDMFARVVVQLCLLVAASRSCPAAVCDYSMEHFQRLDQHLLTRQHGLQRIPKILHHIYLGTSDFPPLSAAKAQQWEECVRSCVERSADFVHIRWNNSMVLSLLERHYPWALQLYSSYHYPVQRADSAR